MEDVLMTFLLSILEQGGAVEAHPLIQQLLDLMWLLMEVSCLSAASSLRIPGTPWEMLRTGVFPTKCW